MYYADAQERYRQKNKDKLNKYYREWYNKNKDRIKLRRKEYYNLPEIKERNRKYWEKNKDEKNRKVREKNKILKLQIINGYGGKCECCSENKIEFLTLDHLNNDGAKHRKEIGGSKYDSRRLYRWAIVNNFPKSLRMLCFNCNISNGIYGYCPHMNK